MSAVQKMLDVVMKSDRRIRYATIFDMEGKELGIKIREGVKFLISDEEHNAVLRAEVDIIKVRSKLGPKIGKTQYEFTVYDNLDRLVMPVGEKYVLAITWDPKGATMDIFKHIQKALKEN